jgi:hypothetical protein
VSLNQVTLTLDVYDGSGSLIQAGQALFTPSSPLTDTTDHLYIWQSPVAVSLVPPAGAGEDWLPTVTLYSCDSTSLQPEGWAWQVAFQAPGAPPGFSFFLDYSNGADQYLDDQTPVYSVTTMQGYMPLPSGTPSAGQVPVATGSGEASAWGAASSGSGLVTLTDAATVAVNAAAGSVFRLTLGGNRTLGTPSNPVDGQRVIFEIIQGSGGGFTLGFSAAYAFPASVPQPSFSTTAGQRDFVSFIYDGLESLWQCTGFVPDQNAGIVPVAQGGTGQSTQAAAITALTGTQTSGYVLRSNGTNAALAAIQAGDLPAATTSAQGALQLDGTASDIQPFGTAAAAGSSGLAPDARHVHLGFFGGIFGSGSDGVLALNGTNTYSGLTLTGGNTYTATRDIQATSITISGGITLKTANFRIFCRGTISNSGTISSAGNNASGATAGAVNVSGSMAGGRAGGNGGTGVSGAGAAGTASAMGSAGGAGGAGTSGGAGAGGTTTDSSSILTGSLLLSPFPVLTGFGSFALSTLVIGFGAGGGGGGSDASSNAGGGGGGGGGVVALLAFAVVNSGTISAAGGNGANGTAGNAGGGGGGAGGAILVYTLVAWTAGTTNAAGGSPGSGSGTGSAGSTGGAGLVFNSVLA